MIGRWRRRDVPAEKAGANDPFAVLGLSADADLIDDDVRSAWRRVAAASHPDRADGGDPGRFAAAAAAYTDLRTSFGRGEARAELVQPLAKVSSAARARGGERGRDWLDGLLSSARNGRPTRLTLRVGCAVAAAVIAVLAAGRSPAGAALVAGCATWLALTIRNDLSRR
jgi:hypothetical protein